MSLRGIARGAAIAALGVAGLVLAARTIYLHAPRRTPEGQPPLGRLDAKGIDRLSGLFDAARDEPRVLVLLSPT